MMSLTLENRRGNSKTMAAYAHIALVAALVAAGSVSAYREALAGCVAAAAVADAGLNTCSSNHGKALYDCVANVLDRLSSDIAPDNVAPAQRAIAATAARLRAAVTKAEALSAITQCRALVVAAMNGVKAAGRPGVGLEAVVATISHAVRLIQTKG